MTDDTRQERRGTRLIEADDRVRKLERHVVSLVTGYFERRDRTPATFLADLEALARSLDKAYVEAANAALDERKRSHDRP